MARDGQTHRDYGTHILPEVNWKVYDACHRCGAQRGEPCRDMRIKHLKHNFNWAPHAGRAVIDPLTADPKQ